MANDRTDTRCAICGGESFPWFTAGSFRMYRCGLCRTTQVLPTPSDDFLRDFYARFHLELDQGGGYELFEGRMARDFAAKVGRIRQRTGPGPVRLLDVGCGKGFFVKACRDTNIDATGIDLSSSAIEYARNTLGLALHEGTIEDRAGVLGLFDVVTFWATIEHLPDPLRTLRTIRTVLKPGGLLFLDTGIGADSLDNLLPGCTQWYDPPQHLFVFSREGVRTALEKSGFKDVTVDPCFERSGWRKLARQCRNYAVAAMLRAVATLGRLHDGPFKFTRYPLGNLMFITARASEDAPGWV